MMIQWKELQTECTLMKSVQKLIMTTENGTLNMLMSVNLQDILLPEFVINRRVVNGVQGARIFDSPLCHYNNIIIGCDFL